MFYPRKTTVLLRNTQEKNETMKKVPDEEITSGTFLT